MAQEDASLTRNRSAPRRSWGQAFAHAAAVLRPIPPVAKRFFPMRIIIHKAIALVFPLRLRIDLINGFFEQPSLSAHAVPGPGEPVRAHALWK